MYLFFLIKTYTQNNKIIRQLEIRTVKRDILSHSQVHNERTANIIMAGCIIA